MRKISDYVQSQISAEVTRCETVLRGTWDGEGYNIWADFVVLWRRDDDGSEDCGTHQGTIRVSSAGTQIEIFWGHYGQSQDSALIDYRRRCEGL